MTKTFALLILLAAAALAQRTNPGPSPRPQPELLAALHKIYPVTTGVREDDHPAVASGGGRVWLAWVSFSETTQITEIHARSMQSGKWSEPIVVSEAPGDYHKPAIAVDAAGAVWVAWPAQVRGNWDIYGRVLRGKQWGKTERWTTDAGSDLAPQLAASKDGLLLVWQGVRKKNLDILYRYYKGSWGKEGFVTDNPRQRLGAGAPPRRARWNLLRRLGQLSRRLRRLPAQHARRCLGARNAGGQFAEARKSRHACRGQLRSSVDRLGSGSGKVGRRFS